MYGSQMFFFKKKQNPNFLEKHNSHEWLQLCIMSLVLKGNQKIKVVQFVYTMILSK